MFRVILLLIALLVNTHRVIMAKSSLDIPKLYFSQILDGLSESKARCILEDHRGFIWVGTHRGLNRFDGTNFKIFEINESDSSSIPDNRINDLFIDSNQNLWIATYNGIGQKTQTECEKAPSFILP